MRNMFFLSANSLRGIIRDRVLYGVLAVSLIFLTIPSISALSMRQATELSLTLSFSIISFLLLLLTIIFSSFSVWRDIERRYTYSVLALPVSRSHFILAKFIANVVLVILCSLLFAGLTFLVVSYSATVYPPERPLLWGNISYVIVFNALQYVLLSALGILFSTVSTSFFLPIFGTIAIFMCGSFSQDVYNYLASSAAADVPVFAKQIFNVFYYLLPNFSAFDFKYAAIYSMSLEPQRLWLTLAYFVVYTALVMFFACFFFSRRELR